MDELLIEQSFRRLAKILVSMTSEIFDLQTSIIALKSELAHLQGKDVERVLSDFHAHEEKLKQQFPVGQKAQEAHDLLDLFEKHGKEFGKNEA